MNENQQFLLYTAPSGDVKVAVFFKDETVWLTQKALAELFGVNVPAINKYLKNIFESGELIREATVSKMEIVQPANDKIWSTSRTSIVSSRRPAALRAGRRSRRLARKNGIKRNEC